MLALRDGAGHGGAVRRPVSALRQRAGLHGRPCLPMNDDSRDSTMTQTSGSLPGGGPPSGIAVAELPAADRPADPPRAGVLWWLAIGIIVADQATKAMVRGSVALFDSRPLVPGLV